MLVVEGMTMQYKGEKKAAVGSARIYWSGFTGAVEKGFLDHC